MPRNYSNAKSLKDVEQAFTYKKPKPDQVERYEELMGCAKLFAQHDKPADLL